MTLSEAIQRLKDQGMSEEQIAARLDVSWWTVRRWGKGRRPHPTTLRRFNRVFSKHLSP